MVGPFWRVRCVSKFIPAIGRLWALGGDGVLRSRLMMLGRLIEEAIPHIKANGGHRIECKARMDRAEIHPRLRLLGFRPEGRLHRFGTDRARLCSILFPG